MQIRTLISSLAMLLASAPAHAAREQAPDISAKIAYLENMVFTLGVSVAALAAAIIVLSVFLFVELKKLTAMRREHEQKPFAGLNVDDLMPTSPPSPPSPEDPAKDAVVDKHLALAAEAAGQRRFADAIMEYDLALKANEFLPDTWNDKAVALMELGRFEEAVEACENSLFIKSGIPHVWKNKANALAGLGRFEEAMEAYEYLLKLYPEDFEAWYGKGVVLAKLGRTEDALSAFCKAIEARPDLHEAYYNCACAHAVLGNKKAAMGDLKTAIDLKPEYKESARADDDLKSLHDDEDFKGVTGATGPV